MSAPPGSRLVTVASILAIAAAVFASGFSGLANGFLNYDDPDVVLSNPRLDDPDAADVAAVFSEVRDHAYLPLYYLALMPEAALAGKDARAFHLGSLLWHLLNGILVLALVRTLGGGPYLSLAAALLFVVHPLTVESVAWVSGRKDQVSLALLLGGLIAWTRWLVRPSAPRLALSLLLPALSLLAKGSTVVFPLLMAAIAAFQRGRRVEDPALALAAPDATTAARRDRHAPAWLVRDAAREEDAPSGAPGASPAPAFRSARPLLPLIAAFVIAGGFAALHYAIALREGTAGAGATHGASEGAWLFTQALAHYAAALFAPVSLSIHYGPDLVAPSWLGVAFLAVLVAGVVLLRVPRATAAGLASAWILASLLPFNDVFPRTSVAMADRYLAVALPAFAALLALALERTGKARWAALVAIVGVLGWLTHARTQEFHDGETVFRSAMRAQPEDPLPPAQVAEALLARPGAGAPRRAAQEEAVGLLARSLSLAEKEGDPVRTLRARLRYADTLLRLGRFAAARDQFVAALEAFRADPQRFAKLGVEEATIDHNHAVSLIGMGLVTDGRRELEEILDRWPRHLESRLTLAQLQVHDGLSALAETQSDEIQDRARHLVNRAITGLREAVSEIDASPRAVPADAEVRIRAELARALMRAPWQENSLGQASAQMQRIVDRWPERAEGWILRSELAEMAGDPRGARADLRKARAILPDDPALVLRESRSLRAEGRNQEAVALLLLSIGANPDVAALKQELAGVYVAQANAHKNSQQLDKALAAARQARELDPANGQAHVSEGAVLEAKQRWEEAEACYRRALAIDAKDAEAKVGLARFHQARGLTTLSQLRARVESVPEAERAELETKLRDLVMADFRTALELGAGSPDVKIARDHVASAERGKKREASDELKARARDAMLGSRNEEAVGLLEQAVKVDGTDLEAHYLLGCAHEAAGNRDAAIKSIEDALTLDPENLPALLVATRLYYVKGRFDDVRKVGNRALSLADDDAVREAFAADLAALRRILDLAKK